MQADGAVAARRYGHGRGARAVDARRTHKRRTELLQLMLCLCYAPLSGDDDAFSLPPPTLVLLFCVLLFGRGAAAMTAG